MNCCQNEDTKESMSQWESSFKSFFRSAIIQICESLSICLMWATMNLLFKLETYSRDINVFMLEIRILQTLASKCSSLLVF